ncbi:DUF488 domain-containing protein [soil metagenome]
MSVLYTIGRGTRSVPELAAVLTAAAVDVVIDVRRHPGSRRNPHLSGDSLAVELPATAALAYEWWGEELGGRRSGSADSRHPAWRNASLRAYADHMDTTAFREAFVRLMAQATDRAQVVMCAETLWWRCHRRLLADAATLQGVEVLHLLGQGRSAPHVRQTGMRAGADGWPVYDVGAQLALPDDPA